MRSCVCKRLCLLVYILVTSFSYASKPYKTYRCLLAITPGTKISSTTEALAYLNKLHELEFMADKAEFDQLMVSFGRLPFNVKAEIFQELMRRHKLYTELNETVSPNVESRKRVTQALLANIHNPAELYLKYQLSPDAFLDKFLAERGAPYTGSDLKKLARLLNEYNIGNSSNNRSITKITIAGSLTNGFAKSGSDLDLVLHSRNDFTNYKSAAELYPDLEHDLQKINSPLKTLNLERSKIHYPNVMSYMEVGTKLMIEVTPEATLLVLYPPQGSSIEIIRVPLAIENKP